MPYVISVVTQKGGVGKSTTCINLSAALARLGHPTLLIDIDPQGNCSTTMGRIDPYEAEETTASLLLNTLKTSTPWTATVEDEVSLICANIQLARAERELHGVGYATQAFVLREQLSALRLQQFDVVLIDCPPSLSLLTVNALVASDFYLIPVESGSKYALDGLDDLEATVHDIQRVNQALRCLGILVTKHESRRNINRGVLRAIEEQFGDRVFPVSITSSTRIKEAESLHQTIFQRDPKSVPAQDYLALGRHVCARLGLHNLPAAVEEEIAQVEVIA